MSTTDPAGWIDLDRLITTLNQVPPFWADPAPIIPVGYITELLPRAQRSAIHGRPPRAAAAAAVCARARSDTSQHMSARSYSAAPQLELQRSAMSRIVVRSTTCHTGTRSFEPAAIGYPWPTATGRRRRRLRVICRGLLCPLLTTHSSSSSSSSSSSARGSSRFEARSICSRSVYGRMQNSSASSS